MPDALYFTENQAANELIAKDPFALLMGFAIDQQVPVQKAFAGPLALKQRVGTLDPAQLAKIDLEPAFREKPAIHRFPGAMAAECASSPRSSPRSTAAMRRGSGARRGTPPS